MRRRIEVAGRPYERQRTQRTFGHLGQGMGCEHNVRQWQALVGILWFAQEVQNLHARFQPTLLPEKWWSIIFAVHLSGQRFGTTG
jgi:hypothetical protein